jgi:hypothetical protein
MGSPFVAAAPISLALALSLAGCATYQDDLARSQKAFEQNQHERALAILRALENDSTHLSPAERAQYAYLRGMTDYRIGYRSDARHWLAAARAIETQTPNSLPEEWTKRMNETLGELNDEVYVAGIQALDRKGGAQKPAAAPAPKKKDNDFDQ